MDTLTKSQPQLLFNELYHHCLTTFRHSLRVGDELYNFANYMNLKDTRLHYLMGILHDIGKLKIPNSILNKNSPLTELEFEEIKKHTLYGKNILEVTEGIPNEFSHIVMYHHENFDGSGYYGLKGNEIPLISRMIRIIDSYDTMLHGRHYQTTIHQQDTIDELYLLRGQQFDPELVTEYLRYLKQRYTFRHKILEAT